MATVAVPKTASLLSRRVRPVTRSLLSEWRELGGLGRVAALGVLASGFVAVALGLSIHASVRHNLLGVRAEMIEHVIESLQASGLLPLGDARYQPSLRALDAAIEHQLIGGEITSVAIRDARGAVVYGDPPAAAKEPGVDHPLDARHVEQHGDGLLHFRLPVLAAGGERLGTFEVFQHAASLDEVLDRVGRNLWLSISTGLLSLGAAMGALTLSHARALDRRRRHAEQLLRDLLHAEDAERRRIVGALHDDIGQPLYRVLYGLEGCRAKLPDGSEVDAELERLGTLVRGLDRTLRGELHHLHRAFDTLDFESALKAIARECHEECGLRISVAARLSDEPSPMARSILLRAVEEALTNVRKHAAAQHVHITARGRAGAVTVEVRDDGRGYHAPRGLGLTTAQERLEAIGGVLYVAAVDGGTTFTATVPATAGVDR